MNGYLRACHGKSRLPSRRAARRRARQIRGEGGPRLYAYRCSYCGHVHLGHPPGYATHLRAGPYGPIHVQEIAA